MQNLLTAEKSLVRQTASCWLKGNGYFLSPTVIHDVLLSVRGSHKKQFSLTFTVLFFFQVPGTKEDGSSQLSG